MTANDLTFGVELEVYLPTLAAAEAGVRIGVYHHGIQVPGLPAGWKAEEDGSLRNATPPCHTALEIVSPVLKGVEGLKQLVAVCEWLNARGAKVNRSTGFHVHVGFDRTNEAGLQRLVTMTANFEKALYASTGTHSREQGQYCRGVQNNPAFQAAYRFTRVVRSCRVSCRYHLLNVTNLATGDKPTVEFRCFAGTTSDVKTVAYVRLCLGLVEKALTMKKLPQWTAKVPVATSPITRGGEGETALNRLFYYLGWTKGREQYTWGGILDEALPTVDATKKELVRLARKYDGNAE